MRETKTLELDGISRKITVRELTVAEMIDALQSVDLSTLTVADLRVLFFTKLLPLTTDLTESPGSGSVTVALMLKGSPVLMNVGSLVTTMLGAALEGGDAELEEKATSGDAKSMQTSKRLHLADMVMPSDETRAQYLHCP